MQSYSGKIINKRIVIGKLLFYEKKELVISEETITDVESEWQRFLDARELAKEQLGKLYEKALAEAGEEEAAIFDIHIMMLDDGDYSDSIEDMIKSHCRKAEYAVTVTGDTFATMFAQMDDDYMRARSADIKDISRRVTEILLGAQGNGELGEEAVILVAEDLAPSETVQMDKTKLLGFVTKLGSTNSHTAILARTMDIPAITEVEIDPDWNGKTAILDATRGLLIVNPDEEALAKASEQVLAYEKRQKLLAELKGKETVTKDGRRIHLYANIGGVNDADLAVEADAEGVGLFRSEFLYLESDNYPSEEKQFQAYKAVAEKLKGKKVIIRTLDIGADKQVDYFNLDKEANPALGYRAIRICLTREEIFKTQLRALLRASVFGKIAIMFPMIISVDEVRSAKAIYELCKKELRDEGIAYEDMELGVMIETPAAVMISDELAKEVDFFSIGTNDLTQYTLAIDRQNPKLDTFYDSHHPAVLKLIQMTIDNGHAGGAWVGICGELGADLSLTKTFVDMGIDELSVSPAAVLSVREAVRNI